MITKIVLLILLANIRTCSMLSEIFSQSHTSSNNNMNEHMPKMLFGTNLLEEEAASHNQNHNEESDDHVIAANHKTFSAVEDQSSSNIDMSIFGNTGESFFEFANRRVSEMKSQNKLLFDKAINSCSYSPTSVEESIADENWNNQDFKKRQLIENRNSSKEDDKVKHNKLNACVIGNFTLNENVPSGRTSDRIFMYDATTVGLINSAESSMRLFSFNQQHKTLSHLRAKFFNDEVPNDACTDKYKSIYIVFTDQNKIAKYQVIQGHVTLRSPSRSNKTRLAFKELISITENDFFPSAVSCHDDLIYVSERPRNQIRVYDKLLRIVNIIYLNGVVVSPHRALAVNQNVRVLIDGVDAAALFNPTTQASNYRISSKKKYSLVPENNRVNICHFYKKMNCLEDVHAFAESKSKSLIYLVNSCEATIVEFLFNKEERMKVSKRLRFPSNAGTPVSVTTNQYGYLFVLTDTPRKIYVIDPKECVD